MKVASNHSTCRHCGVPLDALARRRGLAICGAAQCRYKEDAAHTAKIKQALADSAPAAARNQLQLREVPVAIVWLKHCEPQMAAVEEDDRTQHRAWLEEAVTDRRAIDRERLSDLTADDRHPQGARLCAQCRGRCCEHGAQWRAFIDFTVLSRWQQAHPESSLADAVDAYMSLLPAEHVQGACLYQTASGCAIPRESRADICNGFACDALERVQREARCNPGSATIAITFHRDQVERAAVIGADATQAITLSAPNT